MDSRIAESKSLSLRTASNVHFPLEAFNASWHSSRRASMYPSDGSEEARQRMAWKTVKVTLYRVTLLVIVSRSEIRSTANCAGSSREIASLMTNWSPSICTIIRGSPNWSLWWRDGDLPKNLPCSRFCFQVFSRLSSFRYKGGRSWWLFWHDKYTTTWPGTPWWAEIARAWCWWVLRHRTRQLTVLRETVGIPHFYLRWHQRSVTSNSPAGSLQRGSPHKKEFVTLATTLKHAGHSETSFHFESTGHDDLRPNASSLTIGTVNKSRSRVNWLGIKCLWNGSCMTRWSRTVYRAWIWSWRVPNTSRLCSGVLNTFLACDTGKEITEPRSRVGTT